MYKAFKRFIRRSNITQWTMLNLLDRLVICQTLRCEVSNKLVKEFFWRDMIHCFWNPAIFGFVRTRYATSAILSLINRTVNYLARFVAECGRYVFRSQESLDLVNHSILLNKLNYHGILEALLWVGFILIGDKGTVGHDLYHSSHEAPISRGVPQGRCCKYFSVCWWHFPYYLQSQYECVGTNYIPGVKQPLQWCEENQLILNSPLSTKASGTNHIIVLLDETTLRCWNKSSFLG